ncbi:MAG: hypothetical protein Pars2KO_30150 [Parasphingorhabdus sp.]
MKPFVLILLFATFLGACSETDLDILDKAELEEVEKQVETSAQSLEEAADEAVKVLEEEIQLSLDEDGIGTDQQGPVEPAELEGNQEQ